MSEAIPEESKLLENILIRINRLEEMTKAVEKQKLPPSKS